MAGSGVLVTLRNESVQFIEGGDEIDDRITGLVIKRAGRTVAIFESISWHTAIMLEDFPGGLSQDETTGIWRAVTPKEIDHGIPDADPEP